MKKLFLYLALATGLLAADAANDIVLSQRNSGNTGFVQRNVAPVASGFLAFDASKVPTSPADVTFLAPVFNVSSTSTASLRGILASQYSASTDSAKFSGRKARGTASVPTVITTGDFLTRWSGWGYDGSNFLEMASVVMGSTGTIASTRVPTFIAFQTATNAAPSVLTEAARFESDQSLRFPSTNTAGLQLYNTVDQVTNYERLEILFASNEAIIRTLQAGTGSTRNLHLAAGSGSSNSIYLKNGGSTSGTIEFRGAASTATASAIGYNFTAHSSTATSGTNVALSLAPTYNQASGNAANTDLLINRTQTAVGSGTQLLADFQVGSVSQFSVGNAGRVLTYNGVATAGTGLAPIRATANITGQTTNATITSYANPAADADFEVSAQMSVTASTALATTLTVTYTDVANVARTMILPIQTVTGTFVAAGAITGAGASIWESPVMHIRVKASTTITILTSAGTFTGVTYSASGVIKKTS